MRLFSALMFCLVSNVGFARPNADVSQEVKIQAVSFLSPLQFRIKHAEFNRENFFNSFLMLEVSGTYEGNLCGGDHVVFSKSQTEHSDLRAAFDVKLHSLNLWQREFEMNNRACTQETRPTEFRSQMRLTINYWSNQNAKTWTYRFIDDRGFEQNFRIAFSVVDGWTWTQAN